MIELKTEEEVELLRENNILVSKTLAEVAKHIKPGVTTMELDEIAEEYIRTNGAIPGFLGYGGFPGTLCVSINEEVVHGIPSKDRVLKEGDIVSVDCGTLMKGFYGDSAFTFAVGEVDAQVAKLLEITKESLLKGVEKAVAGNRVGDISYAVQQHAEANGFSVVRELVGHGLGRKMHERPEVPNYGMRGRGPLLRKGMVICIEPMVNLGKREVNFSEVDGWTVTTRDKMPSAHFELAVAITSGKPDVLTTFSFIDQILTERK
ncbi:MAG: type I methionyl aminopeptidase [Bacteroidetes bacterium]|nr:type I methionyl aminopeptidase [Bacteroidota bacterium]